MITINFFFCKAIWKSLFINRLPWLQNIKSIEIKLYSTHWITWNFSAIMLSSEIFNKFSVPSDRATVMRSDDPAKEIWFMELDSNIFLWHIGGGTTHFVNGVSSKLAKRGETVTIGWNEQRNSSLLSTGNHSTKHCTEQHQLKLVWNALMPFKLAPI